LHAPEHKRKKGKKEFQVCLNFGSQHLLTKPQTPNSKLHNRKIYTTGKEKRKIYISMNAQQQITKPQTPYKNREKEKEKKTNPNERGFGLYLRKPNTRGPPEITP
jgi:hypothetical protein